MRTRTRIERLESAAFRTMANAAGSIALLYALFKLVKWLA
jgi:hypothetical protein